MKKLSTLIFTISLFLFLSSCSQSAHDMITGEWQIVDLQTTSDIPDDQMEAYNEQIEEMKKSSKINFKANGSFEQTILDEEATGTWEVSEDGKTLTTDVNGNKEVKQIQELSPEKMVLVLEFDDNKTTTTFEKVK
ncbi:MAG: hypothetical protein L3J74_16110 [Bacteroidales bacterium]|nr:hypothetical protein [Bacteroidales bacterium]